MNKSTHRIVWIDQLRALCIELILWFHTEIYCTGADVVPYDLYVADALCTFYFLSGYLFYNGCLFSLKRKMQSILRSIVVPYFFFTLLLCLPKALFHDISPYSLLLQIVKGNGSWFVSSLITAEVVFSCALWLKKAWVIHMLAAIALTIAMLLTGTDLSAHHNYWNFHNALIGLVFICLGYEYHRHEERFQFLHRTSSLMILLFVFVIIKIYILKSGTSLLIEPVAISNYAVFMLNMLCTLPLAVGLAQRLPAARWLQWTGQRTLVYYFFCGAIPAAVSMFFTIPAGQYYLIVIAFIIVYFITSAIVWIFYRYLPFLLQ